MKQKIKIWDAPTRLFHWLLVLLMGFMWYSATQGGDMLVWHLRGGLLMLALVVFRLCWGIWGSDTAKFSRFVRPFPKSAATRKAKCLKTNWSATILWAH